MPNHSITLLKKKFQLSPQTPQKVFFQLGDCLLILFTFLDCSFQTFLINYPTHFVQQPMYKNPFWGFWAVIWNYASFF
jgi:hypothetical protein